MRIDDVKYCTRCNAFKLRDEFNKQCSRLDGLQSWCRLCYRARCAELKAQKAARVAA
jgi:hypothetical protein